MSNVRRAVIAMAACFMGACAGAIEADEAAAIESSRDVGALSPSTSAGVPPSNSAPAPTSVAPPTTEVSSAPSAGAPAMVQAAPVAVSPAPAAQPAASAPSPVGAPASQGAAEMSPAAVATFDAGSGVMQPDGKTVIFHIADGTGGMDWNTMAKPVRVQHGMTLRLVDDDTTKQHFLHTLGQPCTHGARAIGTGYDCVIGANVPMGMVNGVYDHNGANGGRGRFYIEVVQ